MVKLTKRELPFGKTNNFNLYEKTSEIVCDTKTAYVDYFKTTKIGSYKLHEKNKIITITISSILECQV